MTIANNINENVEVEQPQLMIENAAENILAPEPDDEDPVEQLGADEAKGMLFAPEEM